MNLDSLWAAQLLKEHEEISWYYKAKLQRPVIRIDELRSVWGTWDHFNRTITINRQLITKHSWDVVLEVFKHEMAHQYVAEVFRRPDDRSHGELFKKSCLILGVSNWASRAAGDIPENIPTLRERVLSTDDEKLLSKVEKLLSLAQSSNEHEALLAMERVKELYSRHRLERLKRDAGGERMDSLFLTSKKKKISRTETKIFAILAEHFKVKVIQTSLYDAVDCVRYKAAEVLGRREDVLMAEYVYAFLTGQIESLWKQRKKSFSADAGHRVSFELGVLTGFSEKLRSPQRCEDTRPPEVISEERALVLVEKREFDEYVRLKYPRLATRTVRRGALDSNTFASGQRQGRQLNLSRPMTTGRGFGGFLLSGK